MLKLIQGRLKENDKVMWRGAFGADQPKEAIVDMMELCAVGSKSGRRVKSVLWNTVKGYGRGHVIVYMNNGHWAYGDQLNKL